MKGFIAPIEKDTRDNQDFRKVWYTGKHCQLVLMSVPPGGEIGTEVHQENDQFFRCEAGEGKVVIDGHETAITDGDAVIVPAGAVHNIINTSATDGLKLYTIYAPPHHRDGIVRHTRQEAEAHDAPFDGATTE